MKNRRNSQKHATKSLPERRQYFNTLKMSPSGDTLAEDLPLTSTDQVESTVKEEKTVSPVPKKKRRDASLSDRIKKHISKHLIAYLITIIASGIGTLFMFYVHLNREVGELSVSVKNNSDVVKEFKEDLSKVKDMVFGLIKKK